MYATITCYEVWVIVLLYNRHTLDSNVVKLYPTSTWCSDELKVFIMSKHKPFCKLEQLLLSYQIGCYYGKKSGQSIQNMTWPIERVWVGIQNLDNKIGQPELNLLGWTHTRKVVKTITRIMSSLGREVGEVYWGYIVIGEITRINLWFRQ